MLSPQQQKIVDHKDGPVLVVSCPGSGKTTVIVNRVAKLIESGVNPKDILVITFTKEAANEMGNRFVSQFGIEDVSFGTIHSFCFRVLIQNSGYKREDILTDADKYVFLATDMRENTGKIDETKVKALISNISFCKNKEQNPFFYVPIDECISKSEFFDAYRKYEAYKETNGKLDFDDMLIKTRELFQTTPSILEHWQKKYSYLMVDEYQDTSTIQSDICNMLIEGHKNICVVGDDDQSIYRFRGAKVETILQFDKTYPDVAIYNLAVNYRSTKSIVRHAARLIGYNSKRYKKDFVANREEEGSVTVQKYKSSIGQAAGIIKQIQELEKKGVPYNEMACLYRTNMQNQLLIHQMMMKKIPFYTTEAPIDIHDDVMFKDVMAYYYLSQGIGNKNDFLRILNRPTRYIKKETFNSLVKPDLESVLSICRNLKDSVQGAKYTLEMRSLFYHLEQLKTLKPTEFCKFMDVHMSYRSALKSYAEFLGKDQEHILEVWNMLKKEAEGFETMDDWITWGLEYKSKIAAERKKNYKKGVCLSTFHSAKGLEWKELFIIDADDKTCPHKKAETVEDFEEERRLFYVGVTRAKDNCYISYVDEENKKPSRYIAEMGLKA